MNFNNYKLQCFNEQSSVPLIYIYIYNINIYIYREREATSFHYTQMFIRATLI